MKGLISEMLAQRTMSMEASGAARCVPGAAGAAAPRERVRRLGEGNAHSEKGRGRDKPCRDGDETISHRIPVRLHNRLLVVSGSVQTFLPLPLHCSARQPENATALFHERIPFFRVPASRGTFGQAYR